MSTPENPIAHGGEEPDDAAPGEVLAAPDPAAAVWPTDAEPASAPAAHPVPDVPGPAEADLAEAELVAVAVAEGDPSWEPAAVQAAAAAPVPAAEPETEAPEPEPVWVAQPEPEPVWEAQPEPEPVVEPLAPDAPEPEPVWEAQPEPEPVVEPLAPDADELAGEVDEPATAAPGRGAGRWVLVGLLVLLAALVGVLAVLAQRADGPSGTDRARSAARDAARDAARVVFSYDYRHLADDFAKGKSVATGEFLEQYSSSTAKVVSQVAPKYKAVVVADVSDTAVITAGEERVTVLVFLDQQSTSTLTAQPKITQSRLEMTMVRKGGRWLVEKIKAF